MSWAVITKTKQGGRCLCRAPLEIRPDRVETEKRLGAPRGFGDAQVGNSAWHGQSSGSFVLRRAVALHDEGSMIDTGGGYAHGFVRSSHDRSIDPVLNEQMIHGMVSRMDRSELFSARASLNPAWTRTSTIAMGHARTRFVHEPS